MTNNNKLTIIIMTNKLSNTNKMTTKTIKMKKSSNNIQTVTKTLKPINNNHQYSH
jgi:hypothetical protein